MDDSATSRPQWLCVLEIVVRLCLVFILAASALGADQVQTYLSGKKFAFGRATIPRGQLDLNQAIRVAREFLNENKDKVFLYLTTAPEDAPTGGCGGILDQSRYTSWRECYDARARFNFPATEFIKIDEDAVLRFRHKDDNVSGILLLGSDPRYVVVGGLLGLIVGIETMQVAEQGDAGTLSYLDLYLMGRGSLDATVAATYAKSLSVKTGLRTNIEFRADPWFIDQFLFPFLERWLVPPSEVEYKRTKTLSCHYFLPGNSGCSWTGVERLP
jgi:hypothetical protein